MRSATSFAADGVVWSTRRAHLVVVAPPLPVEVQRATPAQYRRRRLVAALLSLAVVLAAVVMVTNWADRPVGSPLRSPVTSSALSGHWLGTTADGALRYVVGPGDSLWSIVRAAPGVDNTRAAVDDLIERLGTSRVVPGQVVEIRP